MKELLLYSLWTAPVNILGGDGSERSHLCSSRDGLSLIKTISHIHHEDLIGLRKGWRSCDHWILTTSIYSHSSNIHLMGLNKLGEKWKIHQRLIPTPHWRRQWAVKERRHVGMTEHPHNLTWMTETITVSNHRCTFISRSAPRQTFAEMFDPQVLHKVDYANSQACSVVWVCAEGISARKTDPVIWVLYPVKCHQKWHKMSIWHERWPIWHKEWPHPSLLLHMIGVGDIIMCQSEAFFCSPKVVNRFQQCIVSLHTLVSLSHLIVQVWVMFHLQQIMKGAQPYHEEHDLPGNHPNHISCFSSTCLWDQLFVNHN